MTADSLITKKSVFLVDDDADVRRSFKILLRARGFLVHAFETGVGLIADPQLDNSGVFLLDYRLPDMNGIELLNSLRQHNHTHPAYLITGDPNPTIKPRAKAAGFLGVIEKPADANELAKLVGQAFM